ncbi:ECF transporter S component [Staphylococcus haemolyticus]|uniref:ECF transporter S component n=1 Tax=Staphylococcus haemolyticus TaxID=1283 RepID=UPI00069FD22E|nr:ECF transporter S component [Staphylococcus haemolyticus]SIJ48567.1 Riboflavin ECF transporter S component RibU [Mycobacteroides abscessus subsp. abscessus]MBE7356394.1 ECF transporter S component [Staphylococcus haemolyticus]MDT0706077.1 ECF transporter S component [Staphylococcus haemolyticus]MDT0722768.1 ECF transporter S component [Staphylococcus haemolyticus]MDT0737132.1 ECF transporter S component [Staphylococcus haemolyticus]
MQQNKRLITISMLSAIAFILTFIKFPLPFLPPYLTLDFSDVPTLLATFLLGPVAGILVALIKNILNFLFNMGDPVGPIANFLAGVSFLLSAYYVTKRQGRHGDKPRSLVVGLATGTIVMTIVLSILNYFVLLPLYGMIFNLGDVFNNLKIIILSGVIPFNIIKGIVISIIFALLYRRLKRVLS